jgi:hypothetical protein
VPDPVIDPLLHDSALNSAEPVPLRPISAVLFVEELLAMVS